MKNVTRFMKLTLAAAAAGSLLGSAAFSASASAVDLSISPAGLALLNAGVMQVRGNVPRLVGSATMVGHHNPRAVLGISVALSLQNTAKLDQFMHDLHDPSSPSYHKYLTPKQFTALYCPSAAQVQAVEQFLKQRGIAVTGVSPNNMRIHASASTAALESAFGVAINDYSANGTTFYSASSDPSVPASFGGYVKAVMGLDDAVQFKPHLVEAQGSAVAAPGIATATPPAGFSPQQIATAYDWPVGTHHKAVLTDTTLASGVYIAIATAYNYRLADIQKFWSSYKLPTHTIINVPIDGTSARLEAETTIDIERSSAMSPGSNILVFEAFNPGSVAFDDMFVDIANYTTHKISVMSTSWGEPENLSSEQASLAASLAAEHDDFVQMNTEGIVMMAAAGDNAAEDGEATGTDNADFPSSDPYILAAGGTHLVLDPVTSAITSETAWTDAGGADSIYFAQPSYQTSLVSGWTANTSCSGNFTAAYSAATQTTGTPATPNLGSDGCASAGVPSRQSSDMSMVADPFTGYSVYFNGRWVQFGGTSFVAPELAGLFAIIVSEHGGLSDGAPAVVYCAASGPNYAADFHDIVSGANSGSLGGTFDAANAPGWDHPTGWGTPDAAKLVTDINTNCQL